MTSALAQASVSDLSNAELRAWIVGLVIILVIAALWRTIFPPRTPPLHEEFVTRKEFDRHVSDVSAQLERIEAKGEARVIRIYDKIDEAAERQTARLVEVIQHTSRK